MSINLNKNRESLRFAWKDVLDVKTDTNWALFGYEGQTNDLKVVSKGTGGIEELTEDLNSGKIMYAFVKVNDPKTSLDKCVIISWQGEGANTVRKGMCANHLRDVENFFTGAQITYNARNEDEMDLQLILEKIAKSGSAYSFKSPKIETVEPTGPVGTVYHKVNPIKEINSKERDQFWRREEEEEKRRIEEERKRKEAERLMLDLEAKKRELEEYAKREGNNLVRNNNIDQVKEAEKYAYEHQHVKETYVEEDVPKVSQSDVLRNQRKQEAHDLIAQRTIDARSVFEKNTFVSQSKKTPEKPIRASILKAQAQAQTVEEPVKTEPVTVQYLEPEHVVDEPSDDDDSDQYSTIKRSPRDPEKKTTTTSTTTTSSAKSTTSTLQHKQQQQQQNVFTRSNNNEITTETIRQVERELGVHHLTDQQFVDQYLYGFTTPGLQARALYDYQAADDTEITFDPGDVITNIDQVDEGWWQGLGPDGTYGLFPANYVELLP